MVTGRTKPQKSKKKRPAPQYWPYLIRVGSAYGGSEIVLADDLVSAGMLVGCGLAEVEQDYEGPRIKLSEKGRKVFEGYR